MLFTSQRSNQYAQHAPALCPASSTDGRSHNRETTNKTVPAGTRTACCTMSARVHPVAEVGQ